MQWVFYFLLCLSDLSSPTKDQTWALAVRAQNPNHWTAREFSTI